MSPPSTILDWDERATSSDSAMSMRSLGVGVERSAPDAHGARRVVLQQSDFLGVEDVDTG
jgi:hypothetical protein